MRGAILLPGVRIDSDPFAHMALAVGKAVAGMTEYDESERRGCGRFDAERTVTRTMAGSGRHDLPADDLAAEANG
jgi:hypothetical protein